MKKTYSRQCTDLNKYGNLEPYKILRLKNVFKNLSSQRIFAQSCTIKLPQ